MTRPASESDVVPDVRELEQWRRFTSWRDRLRRGSPEEQVEAARAGFEEVPEWSLKPLAAALNDHLLEVRLGVVAALERVGLEGVPALTWALESPCRRTRLAAAEALGRIGSERAAEALVKALERRLTPARWSMAGWVNGRYLLWPIAVWSFGGVTGLFHFSLGGLIGFMVGCLVPTLLQRRHQAPEICVYTAALSQLAHERTGGGTGALLPRLRAASMDVVMQSAGSRRSCRELAQALEGTSAVASLPVVASLAVEDVDHLPLPAEPASERVSPCNEKRPGRKPGPLL